MKVELKHILPYLPYDVKIATDDGNIQIENIDVQGKVNTKYNINEYKLLLRPIASMTLEEITEIDNLLPYNTLINYSNNGDIFIEDNEYFNGEISIELIDSVEINNWFFKNHLDVFNLINKGLAVNKK